jgi:hypothetical protein
MQLLLRAAHNWDMRELQSTRAGVSEWNNCLKNTSATVTGDNGAGEQLAERKAVADSCW